MNGRKEAINRLLLYLLNSLSNNCNVRRPGHRACLRYGHRSGHRSLYIVLIFAVFFALMIIIQILSVEKNSNELNYSLENNGISGRYRLFGKRYEEKEIIFPPKIAQELDKIVEKAEYSFDSFNIDINKSNQSIVNEFYAELIQRDHWQEVSNSRHKFYVFSAYYENRYPNNDYIRIISATKTKTDEKVYCRFQFTHTYEPMTVNGITKLIRENWNLKYSAYFILCPLLPTYPVPDAVSVLIKDIDHINEELKPSNRLIIHNKPKTKSKSMNNGLIEDNIAVCVKPFHYEYNKALNLIEFIELNRILGVKHFVFYNHSVGPDVNCALQQYIDLGVITILSWDLNIQSQTEIRTEGLFAALNDCLYRTMNRFKYVLMIDIDEVVVPYKHNNLLSMIESIYKPNSDRIGGFSFRNAFFYLQWPDDRLISKSIPYPLVTLLKTKRKSQMNAHKQRSKCIIIPQNVIEMGNHFVWEFIPSKAMANVDQRIANLHHYRVCEFGGDDCIHTTSVIDRRVHLWRKEMIIAVNNHINKCYKYCNIRISDKMRQN